MTYKKYIIYISFFFILFKVSGQNINIIIIGNFGYKVNLERFDSFKTNVANNKSDRFRFHWITKEGKVDRYKIKYRHDKDFFHVCRILTMNKYNGVFLISIKKIKIPVDSLKNYNKVTALNKF
jgi:hypothetical protein